MKAIWFLLGAIFAAVRSLGQGTVVFNNRLPGTLVTHVYFPSPANPGLVQSGNGLGDFPAGTTDWTGWTPVGGAQFSAQLFAAAGSGAPMESLAPAFPITTFGTGTFAGFVIAVTARLTGVDDMVSFATVQMRVWDNKSGLISDWAAAVAQPVGTELLGMSAPFNVRYIGGPGIPPGTLDGLQSFNLTYNVPEPSQFVLFGIGAFLVWFVVSTRTGK
jgi:hypothetical protein